MARITAAEYRQMLQEKEGKKPGKPGPIKMPGANKYGAIKKEYNGVTYDSTKEASQAAKYDMARASKNPADRVVEVERQVTYRLEVQGVLICKYILDFKVTYADGRVDHVDVKGAKQGAAYRMFKVKKHLMKALFSIEVIEL